MYKILKSILEGLKEGSDKIKVIDHHRILYVPSSIEMYMNGHETVFTRAGVEIGSGDDLDDKETKLVYSIRGLINPYEDILVRREKLIAYFSNKEMAVTAEPLEKSDYPVSDDEETFDL